MINMCLILSIFFRLNCLFRGLIYTTLWIYVRGLGAAVRGSWVGLALCVEKTVLLQSCLFHATIERGLGSRISWKSESCLFTRTEWTCCHENRSELVFFGAKCVSSSENLFSKIIEIAAALPQRFIKVHFLGNDFTSNEVAAEESKTICSVKKAGTWNQKAVISSSSSCPSKTMAVMQHVSLASRCKRGEPSFRSSCKAYDHQRRVFGFQW